MINNDYLIDGSKEFHEGACCQVYFIKDYPNLVFKEFANKKKAQESHNTQTKLALFDLAPKTITELCKICFYFEDKSLSQITEWGYITEYAKICEPNTTIKMKDIQKLVDDIHKKTGLKFWDCHWYNVGLVKRGRKNKVVCIDTGKESFDADTNAWGFSSPGPKCNYCNRYQCYCSLD